MNRIRTGAAAAVVAAMLVGAGLLAGQVVFASDGGAALEDASTAAALVAEEQPGDDQASPVRLRPFARAVHAEIQVQYVDGTTRAFDYDQGRITAIGGGTVTLIRKDGKTVKLTYDENIFVREKGRPGAVEDLEVGDTAVFFSHGGQADLIRCIRSPEGQS